MKQTEKIKSLNGNWKYITDPDNRLSFEEVNQLLEKGGGKKIIFPVNWELAGLHNFSGTVWFVKSFSVQEDISNLSILEFKGVDYFADVWMNHTYLGNHEGYFQSFYFDVSDSLKEKNNVLIVKVNSPYEEPGKVWPLKKKLIKGIFNHHDCRPGAWNPEYGQDQNTGGIWNDVLLHLVDEVYVEAIYIYSLIDFENDKALVKLSLEYYTKSTSFFKDKIKVEITSPSGKKIKSRYEFNFSNSRGNLDFEIELNKPELWWSWDLGKQNLYNLKISGKYLNAEQIKFGIREVKLNNKSEFYLNRKRLFLRGTNVIPTQFLSELTNEKIYEQVTLIKKANINILRMHAHVNRKEYYDECDRQGILVWQDFALQWTYDESPEFTVNASSQIQDMVKLNYNHPSIAFWCCHNEPGSQIKTLDPFLYDTVLSIDNSRIVRMASNYEEHPYDGWYWGDKEHFATKPMGPLVTEFGAQALPELKSLINFIPKKDINHPDRQGWAYHDFQYEQTFNIAQVDRGKNIKEFIKNSQKYQADLLRTAIDFYRRGKNKDITGIFQFMFIDCWPSITWSVVDYYRKKKAGYFTLQKAFQPLYVSVSVRQKKYFAGKKLNIDYWIINDMHKTFGKCKIIFRIGQKTISEIPVKNISEDSITYFNWEKNEVLLPEKMKTGNYNVEVKLFQEKNILSANDFEIEIVRKG